MNEAAVRVLLVYGYQPSGHAAAASSLEEALRARGAIVSRVEVAAGHHPRSGQAVARLYHSVLRSAPGLWGALYRARPVRAALRGIRSAYLTAGGAAALREGVARFRPDAIVCPQAAVAAVFAAARARGELSVPVVSVLTDFDAHPFWSDPSADLVLAPTLEAAAELTLNGTPRERVKVIGVPVHPAFAAAPERASARAALSLAPSAPVILLSGGSHGYGGLDATAAALLSALPRARLLVLCGRNDRLRGALAALDAGDRLRVFGPQPPGFVAARLAASDLHVGKPGGLTAAESLALGVPMVLTRPLPGQEEANARHMLGLAAALSGGSPAETAWTAACLLNDRERLAGFAARARAAGRPEAASAAAAAICRLAVDGARFDSTSARV